MKEKKGLFSRIWGWVKDLAIRWNEWTMDLFKRGREALSDKSAPWPTRAKGAIQVAVASVLSPAVVGIEAGVMLVGAGVLVLTGIPLWLGVKAMIAFAVGFLPLQGWIAASIAIREDEQVEAACQRYTPLAADAMDLDEEDPLEGVFDDEDDE